MLPSLLPFADSLLNLPLDEFSAAKYHCLCHVLQRINSSTVATESTTPKKKTHSNVTAIVGPVTLLNAALSSELHACTERGEELVRILALRLLSRETFVAVTTLPMQRQLVSTCLTAAVSSMEPLVAVAVKRTLKHVSWENRERIKAVYFRKNDGLNYLEHIM